MGKQQQEDSRKIFRNWIWRKFLLDSVLFFAIYLAVGFLVELPEMLRNTLNFSPGKMVLRAMSNALFLTFFTTLWSPDPESVFDKLIKKRNKKKTS